MRKRYLVDLSADERTHLRALLKQGTHSTRRLTRARILLLADQGHTDAAISEALETHRTTVERIRKRFVEEGFEAALSEKPRPGNPAKLTGKQEALLLAVASEKPPEGRKRWTVRLLAQRLVELKVVERISRETVRQRLKKVTSSPGNASNG